MFGLFESKGDYFVGVDFGTSAIKVVELSYRNQKPYLENYGWFDLAGILQGDLNQQKLFSYDEKLKMALEGLLKKLNLRGRKVNVSIPGFSGLVVLIEFPGNMNNEEIERAIEFEAHKYIPTSIQEVSISWEVLKNSEGNGGTKQNTEVLLVAAPKREIQKLSSYFAGSGFEIGSIELETFSIARTMVGGEAGVFLIIDIGSRASNLILVENGNVVVNRTLDVGGNDITNTIAESLSVSKQRAESFKKENKDFINERETAIIMPSLELLSGEARRIINSFKESHRTTQINSVIFSGGTSELFGIEKYFENALGIRTRKGNPLGNVTYDPKIEAVVRKMGASFSVATGLALRGIEDAYGNKRRG